MKYQIQNYAKSFGQTSKEIQKQFWNKDFKNALLNSNILQTPSPIFVPVGYMTDLAPSRGLGQVVAEALGSETQGACAACLLVVAVSGPQPLHQIEFPQVQL